MKENEALAKAFQLREAYLANRRKHVGPDAPVWTPGARVSSMSTTLSGTQAPLEDPHGARYARKLIK